MCSMDAAMNEHSQQVENSVPANVARCSQYRYSLVFCKDDQIKGKEGRQVGDSDTKRTFFIDSVLAIQNIEWQPIDIQREEKNH